MTKYRKKPLVIEAVRWELDESEIIKFMGYDPFDRSDGTKHPILKIATLEGVMEADLFDYIIKGIKNEFYPCKPDIFEASYDKVEDSAISEEHIKKVMENGISENTRLISHNQYLKEHVKTTITDAIDCLNNVFFKPWDGDISLEQRNTVNTLRYLKEKKIALQGNVTKEEELKIIDESIKDLVNKLKVMK